MDTNHPDRPAAGGVTWTARAEDVNFAAGALPGCGCRLYTRDGQRLLTHGIVSVRFPAGVNEGPAEVVAFVPLWPSAGKPSGFAFAPSGLLTIRYGLPWVRLVPAGDWPHLGLTGHHNRDDAALPDSADTPVIVGRP